MKVRIQRIDDKGRLTLPSDFASCLVVVERQGDEVRIRKMGRLVRRRYSFKQLMSRVTRKNIHGEIKTGAAIGKEAL